MEESAELRNISLTPVLRAPLRVQATEQELGRDENYWCLVPVEGLCFHPHPQDSKDTLFRKEVAVKRLLLGASMGDE